MQLGQGEMTTRKAFSSQHQSQQGGFHYLSTACASTDWQQEHEADVQCQNEQLVNAAKVILLKSILWKCMNGNALLNWNVFSVESPSPLRVIGD